MHVYNYVYALPEYTLATKEKADRKAHVIKDYSRELTW